MIDEGWSTQHEISKRSGAEISSKLFLDEEYRGVSGVLFSYADACNYPATPGADFLYAHNPLCPHGLPYGWLQVGREYYVEDEQLRHTDWNEADAAANDVR